MIPAGFKAAITGRLTRDGTDMPLTPAEARAFGMVFQGHALFPQLTVEDNIAFPLKVQRRPAPDITCRCTRCPKRSSPRHMPMHHILALVLHHDEQAVLTAVELSLAEGVPTKTHVLNLLHRLIDGKVVGGPPLDTPFSTGPTP
jgi:ABC-type sugar transport system ATPase subunit